MILNTGSRTDIPAYYSDWFFNRIKEGYVLVRNPYNPAQVTKYLLNPEVVDIIVFCTKNPLPVLDRLGELSAFDTFWFVTITPYGKDIEPFVPDKGEIQEAFCRLSNLVGAERASWRYDPVFLTEKYTADYHIGQFDKIAGRLREHTRQCVVSFIDLYEKTRRNFPGARSVSFSEQVYLTEAFAGIAAENGLQIHLCCESKKLVRENVDAAGCLSKEVLEAAIGCKLDVPKKKAARNECDCLLGADIGAYNTCGHGCLYCYANYDRKSVLDNMKNHDPASPLLTGNLRAEDMVRDAGQTSWKNRQMSIFDIV